MGLKIKSNIHLIGIIIFICIILIFFLPSSEKSGDIPKSMNFEKPLVEKNEKGLEPDLYDSMGQLQEIIPLSSAENDLLYRTPIDVAFIFTNAIKSPSLQYNLRITISSMLKSTRAPIRLNLITDEDGIHLASEIIREIQMKENLDAQHCQLVFISATELANEVKSTVEVLQDYFTSNHDAYYRDFLFFFSLFVHKLLPETSQLILMDIDIKIKGDIAELNSHFSRFTPSQIMGMSYELSPVYRHILSLYRNKNKGTLLGGIPKEGGFPGYNSGVILIKMDRMKTSSILESYQKREKLEERTKYYTFKGHLGDQDLYTLMALDHPELFYTLPCSWNRQLCEWWRHRGGHEAVFDDYFLCDEPIKIIHGNCKTNIPDEF